MDGSLDYIATEDDEREAEFNVVVEEDDCRSIENFIQNGPCKPEESQVNIESVEICQQVVNPGVKICMEDFKVLNVIGRGGYGKVFLAQKCTSGEDEHKLYAMKVLKKARIIRNEKDTAHTKSERNILEMIKHPFLVKLHYAFQNQSNLYIVLTYCSGGELFTYLEREGTLMENQACFYISEISLAIGHLHSLGIIYRDLKPENVLLDKKGHVKLTDFGLSKESVSLTNTFCGTIEYMAPEILKRGGHGKEVDWWSLGTLLFDMLSGGPPFSQECDKQETICKILHATISFPKYFSPEVIQLINGLLKRNPKERLGCMNDVDDIRNNEFFKIHGINWNDVYNRKMEPPFKPELKCDTDVSCFDSTFTGQQAIMTPDDCNGSHVKSDLFQGFSYVASNVASSLLNESMTGISRHSRRRNYSGLSDNCFNPLHPHSSFINESDFVDMSGTNDESINVQPVSDSSNMQSSQFTDNIPFCSSHSFLPQNRSNQQSSNLTFFGQLCNPVGYYLRFQSHNSTRNVALDSTALSSTSINPHAASSTNPIPIPQNEVRKIP